MKRIAFLLSLLLSLAASASAQLSTATISGTVYGLDGQPKPGIKVKVVRVTQSGSNINANTAIQATTGANGVWSLTVPRSSTAWFCSPNSALISGMSSDCDRATPKAIPNASSALFSALTTVVSFPTGGFVVKDEGTALADVATTLNFTGPGVTATQTSPGAATINITGGGGASTWGGITGNLPDQTDLQAALDAKSDASHTHAFSSLTSKPTTLSGYGITDAQGLDSDLTAIAALSTTSFGRGLLTETDASSARSTLGVVIGTDVQAYNADLAAIAGLTPTNDDILQRKAGAWTNRTVAQFKSDLGLATIATSGSASDLGSGTVPDARFPATLPAASGLNLTALNASNLASGTVPLARLSGITTAELSATAGITSAQLAGSIANAKLANSSISIAGTSTSLGGSISLDTITGLSSTGIVKRSASNTFAIAASGTDYAPATSGSAILKGNGSGGFSNASAGTDYLAPSGSGASLTNVVNSITGTSNQITASASTGAITLSTPQDIGTASNVRHGNLGLNVAAPASAGMIASTLGANNVTGLLIKRNTDTSPTGNYFDFQNAAGTTVAKLDVAGALTVTGCTGCGGGGGTAADPTASVGLSAVNGVASTFMRSDAAPALSQSIVPTWTGIHTFNNGVTTGTTTSAGTVFTYNSLTTGTGLYVGSTSTGGSSTTSALVDVARSGAQTGTVTTTAGRFANTATGASATNVALTLTASGASAGNGNAALNITAGQIFAPDGTVTLPSYSFTAGKTSGIFYDSANGYFAFTAGGTRTQNWFTGTSNFAASVALTSDKDFGFLNATTLSGTKDVFIRRLAAASMVMGASNNATPTANTFTIGESSRGGTDTNVAGANGTIQAGLGTGTGGGGSLIFRTAPAGSTGNAANTYATAMTIQPDGVIVHKSVTFANLPTVVNGGIIYCSDCTLASPCASGGTGALAKGINSAWVCN